MATDKTEQEKLKSSKRYIELYKTKIKQLPITYLLRSIHDFVLNFNLYTLDFLIFFSQEFGKIFQILGPK